MILESNCPTAILSNIELNHVVATLFNDNATAGVAHKVQFNGSNLASGIYLSHLEFDGKMQVKKMLLLK